MAQISLFYRLEFHDTDPFFQFRTHLSATSRLKCYHKDLFDRWRCFKNVKKEQNSWKLVPFKSGVK